MSQIHAYDTSLDGMVHIHSKDNQLKVTAEGLETKLDTFITNQTHFFLNASKTTGEWLASGAIADDTYSTALDCSAFKSVRLMGKVNSDIGMAGIPVLGSQTSGGTYYRLGEAEKLNQITIAINGSSEYHLYTIIEHCPNFIKLYNNTGSSSTIELDYIGISN